MRKGLTILFTGNGKGKTTAALGMAMRAMGHGHRVCVIQFIKGSGKYGEREAAERFGDLMDWHVTGKGFTSASKDLEMHRQSALEGWRLTCKLVHSGRYQMVILDELTYLLKYGMLQESEVLSLLAAKPSGQHLVITGRSASQRLIESADLVTEMIAVRHPYAQGVKAQRGIEF